jgi:hypothetical protein
MSRWKSLRRTIEAIFRWSLTVKIGGAAIGFFWFLQWIKNELLPAETEERLRLLNLLPHFHWYIWVILLLIVGLLGCLEGVVRWNRNEIVPIIGLEGTLQNEAFLLAKRIRDFVEQFVAENGEMPKFYPSVSQDEQTRMQVAMSEWCNRFTSLFRATLANEIEAMLRRIRALDAPMDFTFASTLKTQLGPSHVMLLASLLMGGGLATTLAPKQGNKS